VTPALLFALPALGAFLMGPLGRVHGALPRILGPALLVGHLLLVALLGLEVARHGPLELGLGGLAPPAGIGWRADTVRLLFIGGLGLLALLLWPRDGVGAARTAAQVLLLVAAGSGLALSADLFNLFVLYELTALASLGLVVSDGGRASAGAALRLVLLEAAASALALLGIALVFAQTGTLNLAQLAAVAPQTMSEPLRLAAFALLLAGFGVKAELFPVNTWVPEVYAASSPRVAGLLAGGVSKLPLLALLQMHLTAFAGSGSAGLLLTVGLLTALGGALAALTSTDLRRLLAYSSIGQLGLVAMAFALPGGTGVAAGVAVALHHLLVKPALFVVSESWPGRLAALTGMARRAPLGAALFALLVASLVGVPPLPGFWAKLMLLEALVGAPAGMVGIAYAALATVVLLTVAEAAFLLPVARRLFSGQHPGGEPVPRVWRALPLAAGLVAVAVLAGPVTKGLRQAADQYGQVVPVEPVSPLARDSSGSGERP
jgi:formate hydrogenlyase subunit 3/multisubunit Na+/H+ antiporter MnhD subunit